jgi:hypothetical protein
VLRLPTTPRPAACREAVAGFVTAAHETTLAVHASCETIDQSAPAARDALVRRVRVAAPGGQVRCAYRVGQNTAGARDSAVGRG